jgi:hypothetical protein
MSDLIRLPLSSVWLTSIEPLTTIGPPGHRCPIAYERRVYRQR